MATNEDLMAAAEREYPITYGGSRSEHRRVISITSGGDVWDVLLQVHQDVQLLQQHYLSTVRPDDGEEKITPHNMLHRLWSLCVGKPGYDKEAWRQIESQLTAAGLLNQK